VQLEEQTVKLKFERASWRKTVSFAWNRIADPLARRQLRMIAVKGRNSLTDDKFNEVGTINNKIIGNSNVNIRKTLSIALDASFNYGNERTL
jgi:hypothetical protein